MKSFGFCVLLLLFGTALVCLASTITCSPSGTAFKIDKQDIAEPATSRKLKGLSASRDKMSDGQLNLEDYGPNDPAPSSKASVRPGPIQHGTPLMPYIPKPSPAAPPAPPAPGHPKLGALP
ncbi:hypothetical protein DCAR_0418306 [Daucus carota subsp. sativus]|uniref:Uncharacterized protein n=1 Tax=Daucus carota subsp. sativus TaxID=79200 RepID=A0AAF0WZG4_DAUCS|nr:PREDICTED: uncharacterized protein LOC108217971 [Daucus carota subsp. sativus]WOG98960.1 hypothetical protein DCAR_0418306 [Daucus carota subsp. sativus]